MTERDRDAKGYMTIGRYRKGGDKQALIALMTTTRPLLDGRA